MNILKHSTTLQKEMHSHQHDAHKTAAFPLFKLNMQKYICNIIQFFLMFKNVLM